MALRRRWIYPGVVLVLAAVTLVVAALLVNIMQRKQEARRYPAQWKPIPDDAIDPALWGENFPRQYEGFRRTAENYGRTRYGGSEPYQRVDANPRLRRLYAGNAFSVDYREDRGHAYSLEDPKKTQRVTAATTSACFHCHASAIPLMQEVGLEEFYRTPFREMEARITHPVGCRDCHDSRTLALRVTRPAFLAAMQARGIDVTKANHQEMRSYVCAQCHVEYYFRGPGKFLVFPWSHGLAIEEIEKHYDEYGFSDWEHAESGASLVKVNHPEFELWSSGLHARSGVSCADCHMPYVRQGAIKISDHWLRSPLMNIAQSCQPCHRWPEEELQARVERIQDRTAQLKERAELALLDAIEALRAAKAAGASDAQLKAARALHRRAHLRWDFIAAENSMGFHSPQESARILGEAIDYARQAQLGARDAQGQQRPRRGPAD